MDDDKKSHLKTGWMLDDNQLRVLVDDADNIARRALSAVWHEPSGKVQKSVPTAQVRQLRYALNTLADLGDGWGTPHPMQSYVPSLFDSDGELKKSIKAAISNLNSLPQHVRGRKSELAESAKHAAAAMVESWSKVTGRMPDKNKQAPSVSSFYGTVLVLLRVQTATRTYYRDGTSDEDFFDMASAAKGDDSPQRWLDALPHAIRMAVKGKREN